MKPDGVHLVFEHDDEGHVSVMFFITRGMARDGIFERPATPEAVLEEIHKINPNCDDYLIFDPMEDPLPDPEQQDKWRIVRNKVIIPKAQKRTT